MIDTSEKNFETTIVESLINNGYYSLNSKSYNPSLCLIPEDVFNFIQATQPQEWQKFKTQYQEDAKDKLLKRLAETIKKRGTLEVLRKELKVNGCRFKLAYFQPETSLNHETKKLYEGNFFTVIRQLHYSEKNQNSLDLVLFLNGLPLFTAELKNPLKGQTVENAVKQYREDRNPQEKLFNFAVCLAHFAIDPDNVFMTTHLQGKKTKFLPFNQGRNNGAGNPVSAFGFSTSYLWENIWQKNSVLDLIENFITLVEEKDNKGRKTGVKKLIFPRYHQLDTVRRLTDDVYHNGVGNSYLIQHSAGSGKSNSIAWLSHRLSSFHDSKEDRIFGSIVVITDRKILDKQLQGTISQFEQTQGIVENIDKNKTSKDLKKALEDGKQIIVTTLQKFPVIVDQISTLKGLNFAVIIDEAHSSQTGESTKKLKSVLTTNSLELAEKEDNEDLEEDLEDRIILEAKKRGKIPNLSYFAFTATPKNKTLELFGTPQPDGSFAPFSLYSMRQAIEEGFILDVLENYTTYQTYFNLLKTIETDPQYDRFLASSLLRNFVELHEHAINQKVAIIIEHFHSNISHQIGGKAKAMIVTRSRLHAVRYKLAIDKYIKENNYPYQTLVAFTGKINDGKEFTETNMNTASAGTYIADIKETFHQDEYQFLIVANKFQTGFDEPLLCAMYVDKRLRGLNAVQTLSRLNRIHPLKTSTFILDFVNEIGDIQNAFQPYYDRLELTEATDPNQLYDLEARLGDYHFYDNEDIAKFAQIYFNPKSTQAKIFAVLTPVAERVNIADEEDKKALRKLLNEFIKLYGFVSQLLPIPDGELEKFYEFARHLIRKIYITKDKLPLEIQQNIELQQYQIRETFKGKIELERGQESLPATKISSEQNLRNRDEEALSQIIEEINQRFGTEFTERDQVFIAQIERDLDKSESLKVSFKVNSPENAKITFDDVLSNLMEETIESYFDFYQQYNKEPEFKILLLNFFFNRFSERMKSESHPTLSG